MRTIFLSILLLVSMSVCHAQIAPPKQTDTLIISSVKYNYADINHDNWPCTVIYKSTQDIQIGNQTFNIVRAERFLGPVNFTVYDSSDPKKTEYKLHFYDEDDGTYLMTFSGYEFTCFKKGYMPQIENEEETEESSESRHGTPSVKSYTLDGRQAINLKIPAYRCYAEGEATIIITVNPAGQVIKADVKDDVSSDDECLRSFAVRAARLSRFSAKSDAPSSQVGEIVYSFTGTVESSFNTTAEPNARLAGRTVNGTLPKPTYDVQASGKVVVEIWVDAYGNVQKAVSGVEGTTVSDRNLWQAARKAALGAHFNMSADAPALQKGTITYVFGM